MPKSQWRERFWSKVVKTETCWLWTAHKVRGYGYFRTSDCKSSRVHRIAYELLVGPIPDGLTLDHLCRNRSCLNPAHLEPVTMRVNVLRGNNLAAVNARKTHCFRGHEMSEGNIYIGNNGRSRRCRQCNIAYHKARRQKLRNDLVSPELKVRRYVA